MPQNQSANGRFAYYLSLVGMIMTGPPMVFSALALLIAARGIQFTVDSNLAAAYAGGFAISLLIWISNRNRQKTNSTEARK